MMHVDYSITDGGGCGVGLAWMVVSSHQIQKMRLGMLCLVALHQIFFVVHTSPSLLRRIMRNGVET